MCDVRSAATETSCESCPGKPFRPPAVLSRCFFQEEGGHFVVQEDLHCESGKLRVPRLETVDTYGREELEAEKAATPALQFHAALTAEAEQRARDMRWRYVAAMLRQAHPGWISAACGARGRKPWKTNTYMTPIGRHVNLLIPW